MYDYTYDSTTGGLFLNDKTAIMSKEPRPVYAQELDFLGMDMFWDYEKQNNVPYMWAEAGNYIYKGKIVAKAKGGSLYERPEMELIDSDEILENGEKKKTLPLGSKLEVIDIEAMVEANRDILSVVEQITVKKIFDYYKRYKKKLDCFHVAFSGGKDSIVLLELVKRALPKSSFMVVFGDTKMEFPDTYKVVDIVEKQCKEEGIDFYRAASHLEPEESWRLFGPPSRALRWCCTVHKSAPQTIKIREVLGKEDYIGADFVGVRAQESAKRSEYEYESFGKKQKGQHSQNPILEWSSAEIWLYIFTHNLPINETYKKGNSRAGCLFCPMGGGKGDYFQYSSYPEEISGFIDIVKETNSRDKNNERALKSYVSNGGWNARKNGRDLTLNEQHYFEEIKDGKLIIRIVKPSTDWKEWIKTLGFIPFDYDVKDTPDGIIITVDEKYLKENVTFRKKFKQVFKKTACCVGCRACEVNCRNKCISFENGLRIDNCTHCGLCHEIDEGCLVYNSLKMPLGGTRKMKKSYNSFANHAPKVEWMSRFVDLGNEYWNVNSLGPNQVSMFKKFLRECGITDNKNELTNIYDILISHGKESEIAWGIIYTNFAYNAQCSWYLNNLNIGESYSRELVSQMLIDDGVSKGDATSIITAFKRFTQLPLGTTINFGSVTENGRQITALMRRKATMGDSRVVLYSLYKFAEACEGYYQFTLTRLLDHNIESQGISPTKIFGFDEDEMKQILVGLTARYPEFIDATFTHNLDKINLREDKTSQDILKLF